MGTHTVSGMIDDLSYNPPAGAPPISAATTDYTGIWGIDPSLYTANGMTSPAERAASSRWRFIPRHRRPC